MKAQEIKKQSDKELEKLLHEKQKEAQTFRFDLSGSKIKNIKAGATVRRVIARILTEINARKV
jgi:ribosomal protein L29